MEIFTTLHFPPSDVKITTVLEIDDVEEWKNENEVGRTAWVLGWMIESGMIKMEYEQMSEESEPIPASD